MSRTERRRTSDQAAHPVLSVDQTLVANLEQVVPDGVSTRASDRLGYAHDASHYLLTPQAVVTPRTTDEVAGLLRLGSERGLSVTFRSGGTSLSGQATADGVLADTRRHFRRVTVLDGGAQVRCQPGATVRAVNNRLAPHHRKLGPDPASEIACTIGGVIANNSSGMACGVELNTYRTLESAVLVLPSGTVVDTSGPGADVALRQAEPELHSGLAALRDRVRNDPESVEAVRRLFAIKNTMGYAVNAFLDHDEPVKILEHLVIGSEGTLAFVAEATFRTVPVKAHVATGLLVFPDLAGATGALPALVGAGFTTIELLDATSLQVAQRDPEAIEGLRTLTVIEHAALLVEFQEASSAELDERVRTAGPLISGLSLAQPAALSSDPARRAALWHIRKGLYTAVAGNRPSGTTALLEDIAVPVEALLPTCRELTDLFERHGYTDSVIFGHARHGNIHFMLNEHFDQPAMVQRYVAFTEDLVDLVLRNGGTLKAEHGTGRIMAPYVRRQYGDELYAVMQEVKRLVDPSGVLNPGVLLNERPDSVTAHLKPTTSVEVEVDRCVECGYCEPVCPSRDLTTTPRRRIVLRREITAALEAGDLTLHRRLEQEYAYDAIETCAVDGLCETACPVLINTGDLVRRLRAEQSGPVERAGWTMAAKHWAGMTRLGGAALGVAAKVPAPLMVAVTDLGRALAGPDTVPRYSAELPAGGAARRSRSAADPAAVYLPACIGTMFGPAPADYGQPGAGVSDAFLALCERAGVDIRVPEGIGSLCCGTPWKSKGMTDGYAAMRQRVLPAVWAASDHGRLPVVCDATSCTEGFQRLFASAEQLPGAVTVLDALAFIDQAVLPFLPPATRIASLALHPTCSSVQLGLDGPLRRVAAAAAEEVFVPDDWGCCAFAGDRGLLHPELTATATAPEASELNRRSFTAYASANRTCELGMTRAVGHPYRHVLEILEEVTRPARGAAGRLS